MKFNTSKRNKKKIAQDYKNHAKAVIEAAIFIEDQIDAGRLTKEIYSSLIDAAELLDYEAAELLGVDSRTFPRYDLDDDDDWDTSGDPRHTDDYSDDFKDQLGDKVI